MKVVELEKFRRRQESEPSRPRRITFRSAKFYDDSGNDKALNINVLVENGNALGILKVVIDQGGIGHIADDGTYYFIPWPCACVEITDNG